MTETQGYKKDQLFTLPASRAGYVRELFVQRRRDVLAVLNDREAQRCFTRDELTALSFEAVMLSQMIARMPREARHA